jgi:hypothetical protein
MRAAFLFLLCTLVTGCGRGHPSGVAPGGGVDSITTGAEAERREQERLERLFTNERELAAEPPSTVASPIQQLSQFSKDVDSPRITAQP